MTAEAGWCVQRCLTSETAAVCSAKFFLLDSYDPGTDSEPPTANNVSVTSRSYITSVLIKVGSDEYKDYIPPPRISKVHTRLETLLLRNFHTSKHRIPTVQLFDSQPSLSKNLDRRDVEP